MTGQVAETTMAIELLSPCVRFAAEFGPGAVAAISRRADAVLADAGLDANVMSVPHARLPHGVVTAMLDACREESGDPAFALHAGARLSADDPGLFFYTVRSARSLGAFIRAGVRYMPLLHDGMECALELDGTRAIFRHRMIAGVDATPSVNEYAVMTILRCAQLCLDRDLPGVEFHFSHAAPAWASQYAGTLRGSIRFGQSHNAIIAPVSALDIELPRADPGLHAYLCRAADDMLETLPRRNTFALQVASMVAERLAQGTYDLMHLASALHMGERSLRRRLEAEGTTHSAIVDQTRRQLAVHYLGDATLDLAQISALLGFAHAPAFQRAFKRWFQQAPSTYRRQHLGGPFWGKLVAR